jgi:hypothetical protein
LAGVLQRFLAYLSRLWHGLEQTADNRKLAFQNGFVCLSRRTGELCGVQSVLNVTALHHIGQAYSAFFVKMPDCSD